MKTLKTICTLLLGALLQPTIYAAENYWQQYGQNAVSMEFRGAQDYEALDFMAYRDGMLVAAVDQGDVEIALPMGRLLAQNLRFQFPELQNARDHINAQDYEAALTILRPKVYPLIKFHLVPEAFTQMHEPIRLLIDTLVTAGHRAEANAIFQHLTLDRVAPAYSRSAHRLLKAHIQYNEHPQAATLCMRLPLAEPYQLNQTAALNTADALRSSGHYTEIIPIYQKLEPHVSGHQLQNLQMLLAYSLILSGQPAQADERIANIPKPTKDQNLFSLYQLLQGSKLHQQGHHTQALDTLTHGYVHATSDQNWLPEMLYLIGDCYAQIKQTAAAQNTWQELTTLHPKSPWAERVTNRLQTLIQTTL